MNEIIIGIDLGTTNSEVAVPIDGKIEIIEENGNKIMPSCVGLDAAGNLIVGEPARNQYALFPERTVRSIKRKMGTDKAVQLGDRSYTPQEISAMILKKLKERAEKRLGHPVHKAVITVPAQFSDAQRQATKDAGRIAGLEVLRIINEPTAACLAYDGHAEGPGKNILAFDLGGGTFDVSVVHMEGQVVEVIAGHGNNMLGGDDIDELVADWLISRLQTGSDKPIQLHTLTEHRLRNVAEQAKLVLSDHPHAGIIEENLKTADGNTVFLDQELHRTDFEQMLEPILNKTLNSIHKALGSAQLTIRDIDEIVLVGGSSRIPAVQNLLEKHLSIKPRTDIHPDLAVAYGAGIMAARLMGQNNQRVLVDITPYTYGISAFGELDGQMTKYCFVPVIKAGTPLPVRKSESFYTIFDNQEAVDVHIFQGEHKDARKNILIGRFMVQGLARVPANNEIVLNMNLDLDGVLRVTASEKQTGLNKAITIEDAMAKFSEADIIRAQEEVRRLFDEPLTISPEGPESTETIGTTDIQANALWEEMDRRIAVNRDKMDETDQADADVLLQKLKEAGKRYDETEINEILTEIEDLLFYVETD